MKRYVINGLFMCERMSGIQRYAVEILKRIDRMVSQSDIKMVLLIPFQPVETWRPVNIRVVELKRKFNTLNKHMWYLYELPGYALRNKAVTINMCNMAPVSDSGIVCIHDIMYLTHPEFFSLRKRIVPYFYYHFATRHYRKVVTVSEYTKRTLNEKYNIPSEDIAVIGNGWEHMKSIKEDDSILKRLNLKKDGYYIALGNIYPHKNLKWVLEEASVNPEDFFVIVGQKMTGISLDGYEVKKRQNVLFTGYVSDEENKALLKNAKALLFPSYSEGFGIPPLEMLALGKPAVISDRTCLPEIYGDSVCYIDPDKNDYILGKLKLSTENAKKVLDANSWDVAAQKWMSLLTEYDTAQTKNQRGD